MTNGLTEPGAVRGGVLPGWVRVALVVVLGVLGLGTGWYFFGLWVYSVDGGDDRPGYAAWLAVYRPVVFMGIEAKRITYPELGKERWVNAEVHREGWYVLLLEEHRKYGFRYLDGEPVGPGYDYSVPAKDALSGGEVSLRVRTNLKRRDSISMIYVAAGLPLPGGTGAWYLGTEVLEVVEGHDQWEAAP